MTYKMTPDELANAVKQMIADNGDALDSLTFLTIDGKHSYTTLVEMRIDGKMTAVFVQ